MKHNKCETKARKWLVEKKIASADSDFITVFPDFYLISTKKFIEVKSLQTPKYGKKRIFISYEQSAQWEKLNPLIFVFDPKLSEPIWVGTFEALNNNSSNLPFTVYKDHRRQ